MVILVLKPWTPAGFGIFPGLWSPSGAEMQSSEGGGDYVFIIHAELIPPSRGSTTLQPQTFFGRRNESSVPSRGGGHVTQVWILLFVSFCRNISYNPLLRIHPGHFDHLIQLQSL